MARFKDCLAKMQLSDVLKKELQKNYEYFGGPNDGFDEKQIRKAFDKTQGASHLLAAREFAQAKAELEIKAKILRAGDVVVNEKQVVSFDEKDGVDRIVNEIQNIMEVQVPSVRHSVSSKKGKEFFNDQGDSIGTKSVVGVAGTIRSQAYIYLADVIADVKPNATGWRSEKKREIGYEAIDYILGNNEVKGKGRELGKSTQQSINLLQREQLRLGMIDKFDDRFFPSMPDNIMIVKKGKDEWVKDVLDADILDFQAISDRLNLRGVIPIAKNNATLIRKEYLERVFDNTVMAGQGPLAKDARKGLPSGLIDYANADSNTGLIFKDAESWKKFHNKYGETDPVAVLFQYIDDTANKIGLVDVLGHDPKNLIDGRVKEVSKGLLAKARANNKNLVSDISKINHAVEKVHNQIDLFTGDSSTPVSQWIANTSNILNNTASGILLAGSVVTSVPGDIASAANAASRLGMVPDISPDAKTLVKSIPLMRHLQLPIKALSQMGKMSKVEALRLGVISEAWLDSLSVMERFGGGDIVGRDKPSAISAFIFRINGMTPAYSSFRRIQGMEMLGFVTSISDAGKQALGTGKNAAKAETIKAMKDFGFTKGDLDNLKKAKRGPGEAFIDLSELFKANRELAIKTHSFMDYWADQAIPKATLASRVTIRGQSKSGTVPGMVTQSVSMFTSFPITFWQRNMRSTSGKFSGGSWMSKIYRGTGLVTTMTFAGAIAIQARHIINGYDPETMVGDTGTTASFWTRAVFKGGGLGIVGDLASGFADKREDSPISAPSVEMLWGVGSSASNVLENVFSGDVRKSGQATKQLAVDGIDKLLGLPYTRAPARWMFLDEWNRALNPSSFRRQTNKRRRKGQYRYLNKGRLPNFGNIIE